MNVKQNTVDRIASVKALNSFPYFVIRNENFKNQSDYREELIEIQAYYNQYNKGANFITEGTSGDYVPSAIHYKKMKRLIDKEARFLFSNEPEVSILPLNSSGEETNNHTFDNHAKLISKVFEKSHFSKYILQAAKDCFVGKRVACLVDISEEQGILVHFYNSLQFYYETEYGSDKLTKFVSFECVNNTRSQAGRRFIINVYKIVENTLYVKMTLTDGAGTVLEEIIPETVVDMDYIPAVIITNDGTLADRFGVSEIESLSEYESGYSQLGNADIDSERKGMNPIRYLVDMNSQTTKNLSSSAGSLWELKSEQNQNNVSPQVGTLAPQLNHTEALKTTLERLDAAMYDELDIPNINAETMVGTITSGKALKALYWPLTVRCEEKLKTWQPALKDVVRYVVLMAINNPEIIKSLYGISDLSQDEYTVEISVNYALMDDELEEKQSDLDDVNSKAMSRLSYFKKWRKEDLKTDKAREEELMQIAYETNLLEMGGIGGESIIGGQVQQNQVEEEVQKGIDNEASE